MSTSVAEVMLEQLFLLSCSLLAKMSTLHHKHNRARPRLTGVPHSFYFYNARYVSYQS